MSDVNILILNKTFTNYIIPFNIFRNSRPPQNPAPYLPNIACFLIKSNNNLSQLWNHLIYMIFPIIKPPNWWIVFGPWVLAIAEPMFFLI